MQFVMAELKENSRLWKCNCLARAGCKRSIGTVAGLKRKLGEQCRLLNGGIAPWHMVATEFYGVQCITIGRNSLMVERGRYAPLRTVGQPFSCLSGLITVRTRELPYAANDTSCFVALSNRNDHAGLASALHVFDQAGETIHRTELVEPDDELVLSAAGQTFSDWHGSPGLFELENQDNVTDSNVIPIGPYLRNSSKWSYMSFEDHLDDIMSDGGGARNFALNRIGNAAGWRVNEAVIPHFLIHLAQRKLPVTTIVPQNSFLQAHYGVSEDVSHDEGLLFLCSGKALTVVDLLSIKEAWVVKSGTGSQQVLSLEFYDAQKSCVLAFTTNTCQNQTVNDHWNQLLSSLPL